MKKNGYTLAELLTTVGIIGVIAAITIPMLNFTARKEMIGPAVGKTVSMLKNGMANVLQHANNNQAENTVTDSLASLKIKDVLGNSANSPETYLTDGNTLFSRLSAIIGVVRGDNSYVSNIKLYSGEDSAELTGFSVYKFNKQKATIIVEPIDNNSIPDDIANDAVIERIYIDGNGSEAPNRLGQDVFLFGLTNGGKIVPAGSSEYNRNTFAQEDVLDEEGNPKQDEEGNNIKKYVADPLPVYNDPNSEDRCDSVIGTGRTCAARLAADGWKIKY